MGVSQAQRKHYSKAKQQHIQRFEIIPLGMATSGILELALAAHRSQLLNFQEFANHLTSCKLNIGQSQSIYNTEIGKCYKSSPLSQTPENWLLTIHKHATGYT